VTQPPTRESNLSSFIAACTFGAAFALAIAFVSTWVVAGFYEASLDGAYNSYVYAHAHNSWLEMVSAAKWFSESVAIVLLSASLALMLWQGPSKQRSLWYFSIFAMLAVMAWGFFGQLLPMDQWAWHGTLVRAGIVGKTPEIGQHLRAAIFGNPEMSAATLSRFHLMHIAVMPLIMCFLAFRLWRCSTQMIHSGRALPFMKGFGVLLASSTISLLCVNWPDVSQVEARAQEAIAFSQVRPEWYFIPLNRLLGMANTQESETLVLTAPAILMALLLALPLVGGLRLPRRLLLLVLAGATGALTGMALSEDYDDDAGYFRTPDLDAVMTNLGNVNEALGDVEGQIDPVLFSYSAADIYALANLTEKAGEHEIAKHFEDATPEQRAELLRDWNTWSSELRSQAMTAWSIPPERTENWLLLRQAMRHTCDNCHRAFDEDVDVMLDLKPAPMPVINTGEDADPLTPSMLPISLEGLAADASVEERKGSMDKLMKLLKDRFETLNAGPDAQSAQAIVDSIAASRAFNAIYHSEEGADWRDLADSDDWEASVTRLLAHLDALAASQERAGYLAALRDVRMECNHCHENIVYEDEEDTQLPEVPRE